MHTSNKNVWLFKNSPWSWKVNIINTGSYDSIYYLFKNKCELYNNELVINVKLYEHKYYFIK